MEWKNVILSFIMIILIAGLSPAVFANVTVKQEAAGPNDVWTAPSVIGLDPTSSKWINSLPKYDSSLGAQPAKLELASNAKTEPSVEAPSDDVAPAVPAGAGPVVTAPTPNNPGWLYVQGKVSTPLSNDLYNGANTGYYGVVWALIQIRRCSDNAIIGTGITGTGSSAGVFSVQVWNPGGYGFRFYIVPWTTAGKVIPANGNTYGYAQYAGCWYNKPDGAFWTGYWSISSGSSPYYNFGAWMIYETIVNDARGWGAWNFYMNRLGSYWMDMGCSAGCPVVRFPYETWAHYHPGGEMHLPTMNDARSPDVIQHEYGHYTMYRVFGGYFSTGCPSPHYINGFSGYPCAWSEGWASFDPYAIHNDKTYTYANNFEVNEETPTWGSSGWANGPGVEGRVTAALIDLNDAQNECGGSPYTCDYTTHAFVVQWYIFRWRNSPWNTNFHDYIKDYKATYPGEWGTLTSKMKGTLYHNTIYWSDLG